MGTVAAHDMRQLRALGVDAQVFTPAQGASERANETGVHRLQPWYRWGNGAVLPSLFRALRGFDVIHLHYPFFGSDLIVALAARLHRIPLVVMYHMKPKASGMLGMIFRVYRAVFQPIIFRCASTVLVSSSEYAEHHNVHHRVRTVIPFGVDTTRFVPSNDRAVARNRFGLDAHIPTVLFVGGLDRAHTFKGVDVLLRACAAMTAPWQVMVVGDGDCRVAYEKLAQDLRISDRVHFVGSIPHEDLPFAYQVADVHVLPSIHEGEAFGIVTLEAMATGIPSVVSDLPGMRTLVLPEQTGLRVSPHDDAALARALDRFCANPAFAAACGARARARALAEYDDRVVAERLLQVYHSVIR